MGKSVFTRAFSYRQRESMSPTENYLTEIFAFCLETDEVFRKRFFEKVGIELTEGRFDLGTQSVYKEGRPDIEVKTNNEWILFENKVESGERPSQLNDYASILIKTVNSNLTPHIIFLTKYSEERPTEINGINVKCCRWHQLIGIIDGNNDQITRELKQYLIDNGMKVPENFNNNDKTQIHSLTTLIQKMDEVLNRIQKAFEFEFGKFAKDSTRSTGINYKHYTNKKYLKYKGINLTLFAGFFWWQDDWGDCPRVGIVLDSRTKESDATDYRTMLQEKLKSEKYKDHKWEFWNNNIDTHISWLKPISDFISDGVNDSHDEMKKFIEEGLNELGKYIEPASDAGKLNQKS
jgi:PD-(D/E)XK nuclease superfamily